LVEDGWSVQRCLRQYHIPQKTWYEGWRHDGKFLPAIDDAKRVQKEGVWASIAASGARAAGVLDQIMMDPMTKESVRVQAATTLLDRSGYSKSEPVQAEVQPYATRADMIQALSSIPVDVLEAALVARAKTP
jgi:hypothetical protein